MSASSMTTLPRARRSSTARHASRNFFSESHMTVRLQPEDLRERFRGIAALPPGERGGHAAGEKVIPGLDHDGEVLAVRDRLAVSEVARQPARQRKDRVASFTASVADERPEFACIGLARLMEQIETGANNTVTAG